MMTTPDGWALLFDRLDRIDNHLDGIDGRLRCVERECAEIKSAQTAAKSRVSQEVRAQTDADKSLQERVEKLELAAAEDRGVRKGAWKIYTAIAAISATAGGGSAEVVKTLLGV